MVEADKHHYGDELQIEIIRNTLDHSIGLVVVHQAVQMKGIYNTLSDTEVEVVSEAGLVVVEDEATELDLHDPLGKPLKIPASFHHYFDNPKKEEPLILRLRHIPSYQPYSIQKRLVRARPNARVQTIISDKL